MTDLDAHCLALRKNPTDKTVALALVDHMQETLLLPRFAALRAVGTIRRAHFKVEAIAAATALFTPLSRSYRSVRVTCSNWLFMNAFSETSAIIIRHGYTRPTHSNMIWPFPSGGERYPGTIFVASYWLLKRHRPALYRILIARRLGRECIVLGVKARPCGRGIEWTGTLMPWERGSFKSTP